VLNPAEALPPAASSTTRRKQMPWGIGHAVLGILIGAALTAGSAWGLSLMRNAVLGQPLVVRTAIAGAVNILGQAVFILPVWIIAVLWRKASWRDLGVRGFRPLAGCLGPVVLFMVALWAELLWGLVMRHMHWTGQESLAPLLGKSPLTVALTFAGVAVAAPIAEELFFRGFIYPALRARVGVVLGLVITSAFFALLHLTPTVLPTLFVIGAGLGVLYEATGSIWPGVFMHSAINSLALIATLLSTRLPPPG
jgi:uncharacterized protein